MSTLENSMPERILFVCTGNTCRSPMAQVIAQDFLASQGLPAVSVRSAGVAAFPGARASGKASVVASRAGLDLSGHRSELLDEELVAWAEVVIVMEAHHIDRVLYLGGGEKVVTLKKDVLDPFGCDEIVYSEVFNVLCSLIQDTLRCFISDDDVREN
jgi:protein-tyrosine-phosphatase